MSGWEHKGDMGIMMNLLENSGIMFLIFSNLTALGFCEDTISAGDAKDILLPDPKIFFRIRVKDEETSRGIPLVSLTTQEGIIYYTDSAGNIAFFEPALMNREVYFLFESHGYSMEKEGFTNQQGRTLKVVPGGSVQITMKRENIAQRLYRITGSGIYHDSVLLGDKVPIEHPLMNAGVLGQDSTQVTVYKNKIFWIWGDTSNTRHPFSMNGHSTAATSLLSGQGGLDPEIGVNLDYFAEGNFVKKMVDLHEPGFLWWLGSLVSVRDKAGRERLLAHCVKVKPPLDTAGRCLVGFNDQRQVFEKVCDYPLDDIINPNGHPFLVKEKQGEYLYFFGIGMSRTKPTYNGVVNHGEYEAFTCLKNESRFNGTKEQLDRTEDGSLRFAWRKNTSPIGFQEQDRLIGSGHINPNEKWIGFVDFHSGQDILFHQGSIYYNEYRKRWVMIFNQNFGTSLLGEIWYAEGDTPLGPWMYAQKIVTHNDYSFYNSVQHPHFAKENGRILFFEGTYTKAFSGTKIPTPRYEYNQIMYKLDLGDERCALPVPVYKVKGGDFEYLTADKISEKGMAAEIAFFALDRPVKNCVPVYEYKDPKTGSTILTTEKPEHLKKEEFVIAFYTLASGSEEMKSTTTDLWEWIHPENKKRIYKLEGDIPEVGYVKTEKPLCRVWKYPRKFNPWNLYGYRRGR